MCWAIFRYPPRSSALVVPRALALSVYLLTLPTTYFTYLTLPYNIHILYSTTYTLLYFTSLPHAPYKHREYEQAR